MESEHYSFDYFGFIKRVGSNTGLLFAYWNGLSDVAVACASRIALSCYRIDNSSKRIDQSIELGFHLLVLFRLY
jgi:hypothetical protein